MEPEPARDALAAFREATRCSPELRADNLRAIEARVHGVTPLRRPSAIGRTAVIVAALAAAALAVWIAGELSATAVAVRRDDPRTQAIDAADERDAPAPVHSRDSAPAVAVPEPPPVPAGPTPSGPAMRPRAEPPATALPPALDDAADRLARETRLLGEARRAVAAGELASADAQLDALAREFPHGALVEERWALEVRMHCRAGDPDAATTTAAAFARAHARSALARQLSARPCNEHDSP